MTTSSLSDKEFLSELATYFILYTTKKDEPFDMYLYFRKLKNYSKWNQIFSANAYDEATCESFYKTLLDNEQLNESKPRKSERRRI